MTEDYIKITQNQLDNLLEKSGEVDWNAAIKACIEIAVKYQHSDAHNLEIDEMIELYKE